MRFLSDAGGTSLRYGCILKVYDSRHHDIWNRRAQLDARASRDFCALGADLGARPIKLWCPNFPSSPPFLLLTVTLNYYFFAPAVIASRYYRENYNSAGWLLASKNW